MSLEITYVLVEGKIAHASSGKHMRARAPAIPLIKCILALVDVEWNSDKYEATAENGPVNLLIKYIVKIILFNIL